MDKTLEKYINQDINNPRYLFHGSPKKLDVLRPISAHDFNNNINNIDCAIYMFPSLVKASAYAFKDTIKKNSNDLDWNFEIPSNNDYPVMKMRNVNINDNIMGYIYVVKKTDEIKKDENSIQYKCYKKLVPIDVIKVKYSDFKNYFEVIN